MALEKIQLLGNRVLILLDTENYHPDSLLDIPHFINTETDGGRPAVRVGNNDYLLQGTIIQISPLASKTLIQEESPLQVGDKVYIAPQALHDNFKFYTTRLSRSLPFEGYIAIPHNLIEAKINGTD